MIISALLAPDGNPAQVLRAWLDGAYDLVASPLLLAELERAFAYPKLRKRITAAEAADLIRLLRSEAILSEDPGIALAVHSTDPNDDYLIALGVAARAVIVSGDRHLLDLAGQLPVYPPAAFLELLQASG